MKVEIDLADLGVQLDEEGQIVDRVEIVDLAIKAVIDKIYAEVGKDVKAGISQLIMEKAHEKVAEIISEAVTDPVQLTTTWGKPEGPPTTVREIIRQKIEEFLQNPRSNRDPYSTKDNVKNLMDLIQVAVRDCMTTEMNGAIANAKREVVQVVTKEILNLTRERLQKS